MAITRVQHATNGGDNSTPTVTVSSTTAGNCLVVLVAWNDTTVNISSITDNASGGSNTYTQAPNALYPGIGGGANKQIAAYYAKNINVGATTVTTTFSGSTGQLSIVVFEYLGVSTTSPVDASNNTSATTGTIVSPSLTLSQTGDVMVTMAFALGGALTSTVTPNTATVIDKYFGTWSSTEDFPSGSGPHQDTFTNSGGAEWATVSIALKTATTGVSAKQKASTNLIFE